jgi:protein SCO1
LGASDALAGERTGGTHVPEIPPLDGKHRQRLVWAGIFVAILGLAAAAWLTSPAARLRSEGLRGGVLTEDTASPVGELTDFGAVPEFTLVSQVGDSVRSRDLAGSVWIGDFIFTNCASSCPMMTAQLKDLEAALGEGSRVRLVSFSVDPDRDTPERLAEYAAGYGARPERWLFLTGDKTTIRALSTHGFRLPAGEPSPTDGTQGSEAILHSTRFVLVDATGHIRGYYDATDTAAMDKLRGDIQKLVTSS